MSGGFWFPLILLNNQILVSMICFWLAKPKNIEENKVYVSLAEEAAVGAVVGVGMAGYQPASNVDQHSYMDRDIRDIQKKGSDYAEALAIYTTGKNGMNGDKLRSLQSMSTKYVTDESVRDEMMAKLGHSVSQYLPAHCSNNNQR